MSELVKLQYIIMYLMEIEVGGDHVGVVLVGRVLNGAEIVYFHIPRHNDHAARMLTGGTLDRRVAYSRRKPRFLRLVKGLAVVLCIVPHITERRFFGNGSYSSCLENVFGAEQLLSVAVDIRLHLARKVLIYIRHLVAVEP